MQTFLNSLLFTFLNFNSILECCAFKGILDKVKFLGLPRKFEGKMTGGLYYIRCLQSTYTVKHENKAPTSLFFTIVFGMTFCFNYSFNCLLLVYSILNEHWKILERFGKYWNIDLEKFPRLKNIGKILQMCRITSCYNRKVSEILVENSALSAYTGMDFSIAIAHLPHKI